MAVPQIETNATYLQEAWQNAGELFVMLIEPPTQRAL